MITIQKVNKSQKYKNHLWLTKAIRKKNNLYTNFIKRRTKESENRQSLEKNRLTEVCIFNIQVSCLQSELLKLHDLVHYNTAQIMFRASNKPLPVNI